MSKDRHGWLRIALADAGHRQKDVAKAWGCDDAVVSRFIKTGEPDLTWDRAQTLCSMLGMSLDELKLRLAEGLAPRKTTKGGSSPRSIEAAVKKDTDTVAGVLAEIKGQQERLRELIPDAQVDVSIKYGS